MPRTTRDIPTGLDDPLTLPEAGRVMGVGARAIRQWRDTYYNDAPVLYTWPTNIGSAEHRTSRRHLEAARQTLRLIDAERRGHTAPPEQTQEGVSDMRAFLKNLFRTPARA